MIGILLFSIFCNVGSVFGGKLFVFSVLIINLFVFGVFNNLNICLFIFV